MSASPLFVLACSTQEDVALVLQTALRDFDFVKFSNDYISKEITRSLSDWLKHFTPVFQPMGSKTISNRPCTCTFSPPLSKLQVIVRISDEFIALFASALIVTGICFSTVISNCSFREIVIYRVDS